MAQGVDPYAEPLASAGKSTVMVPLILGGAIIAAAVLLWYSHTGKSRVAEMARAEELVRADLRNAYRELRAYNPEGAMKFVGDAEGRMKNLRTSWPTDYADLRVAIFLIKGEAGFMIDPDANAADAEHCFSTALKNLVHSSGELWEGGMLGRARVRFQQGKCAEAEEDLNRLLDRNPNFGAGYYWRARVRNCLGDNQGARRDAWRAKCLDSWPPLRDFMRGERKWRRDILGNPELREGGE